MVFRTFWFLAGAGIATWWIKSPSKIQRQEEQAYDPKTNTNTKTVTYTWPGGEGRTILCSRQGGGGSEAKWGWGSWQHGRNSTSDKSPDTSQPTGGWKQGWDSKSFPPITVDLEAERARMQQIGKQATDTVTDLSEATLDTLLTTAALMKQKLAERRALRDEEMKKLEEQRKAQPPRWV